MTDVQTRNEVDGWIQRALIPVVKRLEALEQSNADQLAKARAALEKIDRVVTYPVSSEIDPKGYCVRAVDGEGYEYISTITRAVLKEMQEDASNIPASSTDQPPARKP
jgi:hypothetical protein